MAITNGDLLLDALGNNSSRIILDKVSIANQTAQRYCSMWRALGQPAQAAIPGTTPAVPTKATLGAMGFTNQTAPVKSYLAWLFGINSNTAQGLEIHDRIAHNGGLALNVATLQTITGFSLVTLAPSADRVGDANYSDLQWWLEVYSDGGATAANATINVTYGDTTSGNLSLVPVGGTIRAGNMFALTPFIPTADQGKYIRAINSVQLSISTGTPGNFGFTCTRQRAAVSFNTGGRPEVRDWAQLGFPEIANDACLMSILLPSTTSSGTLRVGGKIAHG
jgi:hypothetical protein